MSRRRKRGGRIGWRTATLLLLLQGFTILLYLRNIGASTVGTLYQSMGRQMLAWEAWLAEPDRIPSWLEAYMQAEQTPGELSRWMQESDRRRWTDDSLRTAWAIACHRFSQHDDEARDAWLDEGREALEDIAVPGEENAFFIATKKAIEGSKLTGTEQEGLKALQLQYPEDWFVAHLARVHGFVLDADSPSFVSLRSDILARIVFANLASVMLLALALPCGWFAWMNLRPHPMARAPSARRLFRLWPVPTVLGLWCLLELFRNLGGSVIGRMGEVIIARAFRDPWMSYWSTAWFCFALGGVVLVAVPVVMKHRFTRGQGVLRRTLGFSWDDFFSDRWVLLAAAMAVAMFGLSEIWNWWLASLELAPAALDEFTRSFSYMGDAAVPAMLLVACVIAPLVEEIVFRGFLFASMREVWGAKSAAVVSSLIFAATHAYDWNGTLQVFGFGLACCFMFHRTGHLAPGILMHSMTNAILVTLYHLGGGV